MHDVSKQEAPFIFLLTIVFLEHSEGLCSQKPADSTGGHEVGPNHHPLSPDWIPAQEGQHDPGAVPAQRSGLGHSERAELCWVQHQLKTPRGEYWAISVSDERVPLWSSGLTLEQEIQKDKVKLNILHGKPCIFVYYKNECIHNYAFTCTCISFFWHQSNF